MTFEEFLTKKKIDLAQFKTAEPGLFVEFQSHYGQMGEKSFDHSKKFLFNKLRRAYHLKEEPKPVPAKEIIEVNKIASQAEPLLSPTVEATVYTPRFRAGGTSRETESEKLKTEEGSVKQEEGGKKEGAVKPGYTPRFKAPVKSSQSPASDPNPQTSEISPQTSPPKPAYVPRFKAAPIKKEEDVQAEPPASDPGPQTSDLRPPDSDLSPEAPADKPKPAYTPRFKASVTAKHAEQQEEEENSEIKPAEAPAAEQKPKPAYIPRFKAQAPPKENPPSTPPAPSDL